MLLRPGTRAPRSGGVFTSGEVLLNSVRCPPLGVTVPVSARSLEKLSPPCRARCSTTWEKRPNSSSLIEEHFPQRMVDANRVHPSKGEAS